MDLHTDQLLLTVMSDRAGEFSLSRPWLSRRFWWVGPGRALPTHSRSICAAAYAGSAAMSRKVACACTCKVTGSSVFLGSRAAVCAGVHRLLLRGCPRASRPWTPARQSPFAEEACVREPEEAFAEEACVGAPPPSSMNICSAHRTRSKTCVMQCGTCSIELLELLTPHEEKRTGLSHQRVDRGTVAAVCTSAAPHRLAAQALSSPRRAGPQRGHTSIPTLTHHRTSPDEAAQPARAAEAARWLAPKSVLSAQAEEHAGVLGLVHVALEVEARHLEEGKRSHQTVAPRLVSCTHTLYLPTTLSLSEAPTQHVRDTHTARHYPTQHVQLTSKKLEKQATERQTFTQLRTRTQ
jgi:hypothetical protein